jgi:hypothetical protein
MRASGFDTVDVTRQAEATWIEQLRPTAQQESFQVSCPPSYFNNEGRLSVDDGLDATRGAGWVP